MSHTAQGVSHDGMECDKSRGNKESKRKNLVVGRGFLVLGIIGLICSILHIRGP